MKNIPNKNEPSRKKTYILDNCILYSFVHYFLLKNRSFHGKVNLACFFQMYFFVVDFG